MLKNSILEGLKNIIIKAFIANSQEEQAKTLMYLI